MVERLKNIYGFLNMVLVQGAGVRFYVRG